MLASAYQSYDSSIACNHRFCYAPTGRAMVTMACYRGPFEGGRLYALMGRSVRGRVAKEITSPLAGEFVVSSPGTVLISRPGHRVAVRPSVPT